MDRIFIVLTLALTGGALACGEQQSSGETPPADASRADEGDAGVQTPAESKSTETTKDAAAKDATKANASTACVDGDPPAPGSCGEQECAAGNACIGRDPGGACVGQFGGGDGSIPCSELNCGWLTCYAPCICSDSARSACTCP
jgi:hypothetical protein